MKCEIWGNTWHCFSNDFLRNPHFSSNTLSEFYQSIVGNWYWEVLNSGLISQGYIWYFSLRAPGYCPEVIFCQSQSKLKQFDLIKNMPLVF